MKYSCISLPLCLTEQGSQTQMCLRVHGRAPVTAHGPVIIQGLDRRRLSRSGVGHRVGIANTFPGDAGDAGAFSSWPHLQLPSLEKGPSTVTLLSDPVDAFCDISLSNSSSKTSLPRVPRRPSSGPPWLCCCFSFQPLGLSSQSLACSNDSVFFST